MPMFFYTASGLMKAIRAGDAAEVKKYLARKDGGWGRETAMEILIEKGAGVNAGGAGGRPLDLAIQRNMPRMAELLVKKKLRTP